jgi:hypothetical protein
LCLSFRFSNDLRDSEAEVAVDLSQRTDEVSPPADEYIHGHVEVVSGVYHHPRPEHGDLTRSKLEQGKTGTNFNSGRFQAGLYQLPGLVSLLLGHDLSPGRSVGFFLEERFERMEWHADGHHSREVTGAHIDVGNHDVFVPPGYREFLRLGLERRVFGLQREIILPGLGEEHQQSIGHAPDDCLLERCHRAFLVLLRAQAAKQPIEQEEPEIRSEIDDALVMTDLVQFEHDGGTWRREREDEFGKRRLLDAAQDDVRRGPEFGALAPEADFPRRESTSF